ncbi:MAG: DUF1638 domain-containing protein [Gammaproteobacteria bacterium]
MTGTLLVIACGAIARELVRVRDLNGWDHVSIYCLPAELHNRPDEIPSAVARTLEAARKAFDRVFVAYADCGTGGRLDRLLARHGIERLPGAHCYEFLAGSSVFDELAADEPGSFYLTDFLVRHFDRLVVRGLGLDRHPDLLQRYFGNYRRVVHLAQSGSAELKEQARRQAERLGLEYRYHFCGDRPLTVALQPVLAG